MRKTCTDDQGRVLHTLPQAEPVTCAEIDGAPGYWRDKLGLVAYELRELEPEPCGRDCYLAPVSEYQGTTYPYTMHDRDPP